MTYTINKEFTFSASHVLDGLPDGHQCGRLHGHNYVVRVELIAAAVDDRGFVMDYGDLAPFKRFVDDHLDHRHLNDVGVFAGLTGRNPTAENLSYVLADIACDVLDLPAGVALRVWVSETPKTWAVYTPGVWPA